MTETKLPLHERELLVYRIMCGYLRWGKFKIKSPSMRIKYQAQEVYNEYYKRAVDSGILSDYSFLSGYTNKDEQRLEELKTEIEDRKIDLYHAAFNDIDREIIRSNLLQLKLEEEKLIIKKSSYSYLSCEGIAMQAKRLFILENCTYFEGKRYNWSEISLNQVFNYCNESLITEEAYRELARTEPWGSIWRTKPKFRDITDEQKFLVLWSQQYDFIYKNPDCPHDDIIADNDMLDGWLILKRREREAKSGQNAIGEKLKNDKISQADQVFIVAKSQKEVEFIESKNTPAAKIDKAIRSKLIKEKGEVKESEMPDVVQENMARLQQEYGDKIRNK